MNNYPIPFLFMLFYLPVVITTYKQDLNHHFLLV